MTGVPQMLITKLIKQQNNISLHCQLRMVVGMDILSVPLSMGCILKVKPCSVCMLSEGGIQGPYRV